MREYSGAKQSASLSPTGQPTIELNPAVAHQAIVLGLIRCPECRRRLQLNDAKYCEGAVVKADLWCQTCGRVGLVEAYRVSFLERDLLSEHSFPGLVPELLEPRVGSLATLGDWRNHEEGFVGLGLGSQIGGVIHGRGVRFEVVAHAWSGKARFEFADQAVEVDLNASDLSTWSCSLCVEHSGTFAWSISLIDGGQSGTDQVIVRSMSRYVEVDRAEPLRFQPLNLGNQYPLRFEEILRTLPSESTVLDLGGGDRRHPDPRVVNLEYLPYQRVDLYADGLRLPFADFSFDLVLSQAVLEHVPDPPKAVDEILRVLKPGGKVYAEFAFIQPLHAVPFHFYNITPHGAKLLFEKFEQVAISS